MKTNVLIHLTIGLLLLGLSAVAGADTYLVDRFDDSATATTCWQFGANDCSLRGAIIKANQDSAQDLIYLPAGTYTITIAGTLEDATLTGDLDITENLVIYGHTSGTTINGNSLDRVFQVFATTTFNDLTITGGNSNLDGGGILNQSLLFLKDCTITENSTAYLGGGVYNTGSSLYLDRTTVSSNEAGSNGGGVFNQSGTNLNIEDSTIYSNTASNGAGGGIYNNGSSTIRRSSIWGNQTYYVSGSHSRGGGGIYNSGYLNLFDCSLFINWAHDDSGGAIHNNNDLDLTHVSISGNLSSPTSSTAIHNGAGAVITTVNSIFGGHCFNDGGSVTSNDFNLESPGNSCLLTGSNDQVNVGDMMTTIVDVAGGSYKCVALEQGSPAIDMGSNLHYSDADQRGVSRPIDGDGNGSAAYDIGAFEFLEGYLFHDGFETGGLQRWSSHTP